MLSESLTLDVTETHPMTYGQGQWYHFLICFIWARIKVFREGIKVMLRSTSDHSFDLFRIDQVPCEYPLSGSLSTRSVKNYDLFLLKAGLHGSL